MKSSFVVGKIKGISIEVNYSWFAIFGLVSFMLATNYFPQFYPDWNSTLRWMIGGITALMFFASVLLHELAHSLVSIRLGIQVKKITLFIFGGVAQIEKEPDEPLQELKIAIAGPATSVFIAILTYFIAAVLNSTGAPDYATVPFSYISTTNIILAIFNMIPAFPMDGGRVFRALIWRTTGDLKKATKTASSLGVMFGYFLIMVGVLWVLNGDFLNGIWFFFIGWYITQSSQSSYQQLVISDVFNKIRVKEFMTDDVITIDYDLSLLEVVENYFYKYKFASFPVMKNGEVAGIINTDSVRKAHRELWSETTAGSVTIPLDDTLVISPSDTVSVAMEKIFRHSVGRVLVMDGTKLLGIVSRTDILNYIRIHGQFETKG
ncbi:MAG: CBS domain-containing protein [Eubacteriaceae bacterium]|nr:CBS domain-containing protein [Eubacteriaceae bacterium]